MRKFYLEDIRNSQNIIVFSEIRNDFKEDSKGLLYTTSYSDYEWWQTLADAIEYLEDNGVDTKSLETNELQDYVSFAKEKGFGS